MSGKSAYLSFQGGVVMPFPQELRKEYQKSNTKVCTSNIGSPVTLDKAPNSIIIVPAQAVHVSDSLPVFDDGW